MHQTADHAGVAPYRPNSLDGGCPFTAGAHLGGYVEVPRPVAASRKVREAPASYADHTSQARQFWRSLSPVEKDHTIQAFTFELGKCYETPIRERELRVLANIDPQLCSAVADGLGLPTPEATEELAEVPPSPALSQVGKRWPVTGRIVGIVLDPESDLALVEQARDAVKARDMIPLIVAASGGNLGSLAVQRTFLTARSVEFDAILVAGAPAPAPDTEAGLDAKAGEPRSTDSIDPRVTLMLDEAFRHAKAIGGWGGADAAFGAAGFDTPAAGVVLGDDPSTVLEQVADLLAEHRVWERFPARSS